MFLRKRITRLAASAVSLSLTVGTLLVLTLTVQAQRPTPTPWVKPVDVEGPVRVRVSLMAPQIVADTFGKRIAENFIALQVTVANHDKDYQYLINDVSLWFGQVFTPASPSNYLSSAELSLLRGVAEKGQGQSRRNMLLRLFRGVGTIGAGLIGVAGFGPSYGDSIAIFNGPVINAFSEAFPDYTINQMNRLSDSAYQANTLVPAKHSKVLVAFIPSAIFLNKQQRNQFWKDPTVLYPTSTPGPDGIFGTIDDRMNCALPMCADFRRVVSFIDGDHITEVSNMPPVVSDVQFEDSEKQNFQNANPVVKGSVVGRFLTGTSIDFENVPEGMSVVKDGAPTAERLNFIVRSNVPVPPGKPLTFVVSSPQGVQKFPKQVSYTPDAPTLTATDPSPATAAQGSTVTLTLRGSNFIPDQTRVLISGSGAVASTPSEVAGTSLKVDITIAPDATATVRQLTVVNGSGQSTSKPFTITTAPSP